LQDEQAQERDLVLLEHQVGHQVGEVDLQGGYQMDLQVLVLLWVLKRSSLRLLEHPQILMMKLDY
jgi:hypothetical protein